MPLGLSISAFARRCLSGSERFATLEPSRTLRITCRGEPISRDEVFKYTNGRFLANEKKAADRRYVKFDLDRLCAVAAATGQHSPVCAIEKMEGGFSKALLLRKEDGSEIVAKIPFPIAGPPKYTTASEVAVLRYCKSARPASLMRLRLPVLIVHTHTQVPVPKVLAWSADSSNPVGAEYIIMEKAPGIQLYKMWGDMSEWDRFCAVKQLAKFGGQVAKIHFPANGSLYLRESMASDDACVNLDREMDPSEQFCMGPSCERGWYPQGITASLQSCFNRGPWPDLATYGIALVEREIALLGRQSTTYVHGPPRVSKDEELAVLKMAKEVMSAFRNAPNFVQKFSASTLWHTDLHMGNIYVSEEDPTKVVSIIDWQSIVVAPLFVQARFPVFLPVDDNFTRGIEAEAFPKLPPNYEDMDAEDKKHAEYKLEEAKLAKAWELSTGTISASATNSLGMPPFVRDVFIRSAEVSEEGVIPLRACLIELSRWWKEMGFLTPFPVTFSQDDLRRHEQQFQEYRNFYDIYELAREFLETDFEGWINPLLDFEVKRRQSEELFQEVMRRSQQYNMSPEEVWRIWPYREHSPT